MSLTSSPSSLFIKCPYTVSAFHLTSSFDLSIIFSLSFSIQLHTTALASTLAVFYIGVHAPWFHDADNYWDFDAVSNNLVEDVKGGRLSKIIGNYNLFPGPKDNALELLESTKRLKSHVMLGDFSRTCLPDPTRCLSGFTISFWVSLKKVLNDGVLLQLGLSRKSRGITINTHYKEGRISLIFYGNTPKRIYSIKAELSSHIWHHIALVWNATAESKMSLFVNCTSRDNFKAKMKKRRDKKREGRKLILGANHSGKKAIPIAVDDFAIWFKTLKQERLYEIVNQERGMIKIFTGLNLKYCFCFCISACLCISKD